MVATEQIIDSRSVAPTRSRRKTPEEVEGFESVVPSPGGPVEVLNISNGGVFVETTTRTKPGSAVRVRVNTTRSNSEVRAKVVRSELANGDGGGLRFLLAIAFDEPLDLIDTSDVAVDAPDSSDPEIPMDLLPPDDAAIGLRFARTPNRW